MENDRILKHCTLLGLCLDEENLNGKKKPERKKERNKAP